MYLWAIKTNNFKVIKMSSECFENKNMLNYICSFLNLKAIISFSSCNRTIKSLLDPSANSVINYIMYLYTSEKYFIFDKNESNIKEERNKIMEKSWNSSVNWKLYLTSMSNHFSIYPDPKISNMVSDFFKIHLYLSDLRKENYNLEYSYSSIHLICSYDINFRNTCIDNFYGHYIDNDYINNKGKNCQKIEILREGLPFEHELKNFYDAYNEITSNKINECIINIINNYDFEKLETIFDNIEKNRNIKIKINKIIYFILWINKCLIKCSVYTYETIYRYANDYNEKTFLLEFSNKCDEYTNASLLINKRFDNINIIMNFINLYIMNKNDNSNKFSLYELSRKILKKNVFDKLFANLELKTSFIIKKYYLEKFEKNDQIKENKKEKKQKEDNDDAIMDYDDFCETNNTSVYNMEESDEEEEYDRNNDNKVVIDKILNSVLDLSINKNNANAINHSQIKLSEEYEKIENLLNSKLCENLQKKLEEEGDKISKNYEILESFLKYHKRKRFSRVDNTNSLKIINRTRKKLLQSTFKIMCDYILPKIMNDFNSRLKINNNERKLYIDYNEILNKVNYQGDLSDFNQSKKRKIEEKVQEEINNIKSRLYERNINGYDVNDTNKLVNEYMDNDGIEIVLLVKKMIYFYFKELEFYEEKDQKVYNSLTNIKNNEKISMDEIIQKN